MTEPPVSEIAWRDTPDGTLVVALTGEWDLANGPELRAAFVEAVTLERPVCVDLCDSTFIDSTALAHLVWLNKNATAGMTVTCASGPVLRVLEISGLRDLFGDVDTDASAGQRAVQIVLPEIDGLVAGATPDDRRFLARRHGNIRCMAKSARWAVPTEATAVSRLRRVAVSFARDNEVPDPPLADLQGALGEALANTVMHRPAPDGTVAVEMRVDRDASQVHIRVLDDGPGLRARTARPGAGMGMRLMALLTDELTIRPRKDRPGTEVAMTFLLT